MRKKDSRTKSLPFVQASSSNLFLDKKGEDNAYEPKYLRKIIDYYKNMGMIEESSLPMPKNLYGGIEKAIVKSGFQNEDNELTDFYSGFEQTDAAIAMQDGINNFFTSVDFPVQAIVISIDELSFKKNEAKLQSAKDPNRFVVGAQAGLRDNGDGLVYLMAVTAVEDFDRSLIDPAIVARKASTVMRHELMHDRQYTSLAQDKGITKQQAKQKFEDWGLIPKTDEPREKYLRSHIEIDAYGHEFAEELAQKFGISKAKKLISQASANDLKMLARSVESQMSDNFKEYFDLFSNAKFTRRLHKKIKKYLLAFEAEKIYECKPAKAMQEKQKSIVDFFGEKNENHKKPA